jgi:beta-lactam-binding protein with PASTA domain
VKPKRSIPSVIDNRTYREAASHITAAGFVIERVDTIPGEKDWVYELRYNGKKLSNGEVVPQGASLTVVIGSGKESGEEGEPVFDSNFDI